MNHAELEQAARALVAPGKDLLAADESNPPLAKRCAAISLEATPENRRSYRRLLALREVSRGDPRQRHGPHVAPRIWPRISNQ